MELNIFVNTVMILIEFSIDVRFLQKLKIHFVLFIVIIKRLFFLQKLNII